MALSPRTSNRVLLLTMVLMAVQMGLVVSAVMTIVETGLTEDFLARWFGRFVTTVGIVFPAVVILAPWSARLARWIDAILMPPAADDPRPK